MHTNVGYPVIPQTLSPKGSNISSFDGTIAINDESILSSLKY